eukprot:6184284-Pleurochrysis_carterae.AAC.1
MDVLKSPVISIWRRHSGDQARSRCSRRLAASTPSCFLVAMFTGVNGPYDSRARIHWTKNIGGTHVHAEQKDTHVHAEQKDTHMHAEQKDTH